MAVDEAMQEFIDTRGFFVLHGRQRRAAVLPEVDLDAAASHVVELERTAEQKHRQRRGSRDKDSKKVRAELIMPPPP